MLLCGQNLEQGERKKVRWIKVRVCRGSGPDMLYSGYGLLYQMEESKHKIV